MQRALSHGAIVTLVCCTLAALCEGIDLQAAGVAAAGVVGEFHPNPDQLGNFFSASTLGLFVGALIGGRLSDAFGRKGVLVTSIALFGLFSLTTPLAWDLNSLYWARLITGLGLGGAFPNLVALVAESSGAHQRSANVTMVYAGMPFGGAIASLIAMLTAASHWRWIFIAGGLPPLLLALYMMRRLPESSEFRSARASAEPSARRAVEIFGGGRLARTLLLWVSMFLGVVTLYLLLNWLPTLLVNNGMSKTQAAAVQVGFNVGGALAALQIGTLLEGRFRNASILITFITLPLLLAGLSRLPPEITVTLVVVFLLGCAILASLAFLNATAPECYPTIIRGIGVGAVVAAGRLGSVAGPKLGGVLQSMGHNTSQLLMDIVPLAVVASLTGLLLAWIVAQHRRST